MDRSASNDISEPNQDDMEQLMIEKAHDLFQSCDTEQKGFITKRDMQRLRAELPLSPDQLENVFDSLDDDKNGYLTLEEFTDGFGSFLGMKPSKDNRDEDGDDPEGYVYEEDEDGNIGKQFDDMMEQVGAKKILPDDDTIKALWVKLQKDEPGLLEYYEDFLSKVSTDIKKSQTDCDELEHALKLKTMSHDNEIKKLYEEMEFQIKSEKERIIAEERAKEKSLRLTMEQELSEKERQYQEMLSKQQEMEKRLEAMNMIEAETKQENERLLKEREALENMLYESQESLQESQSYINHLSSQFKDDKRQRAFAALRLSEGIALERESLVKQLDVLKDVNTKLRDDRDEAEQCEARRASEINARPEEKGRKGSILANYFPVRRSEGSMKTMDEESIDDDIECDDDDDPSLYITQPIDNINNINNNKCKYKRSRRQDISDSCSSDPESDVALHRSAVMAFNSVEELAPDDRASSVVSQSLGNELARVRDQPVGAADASNYIDTVDFVKPKGPERIFKVVFVGDSGVGKSSFIHRFCNDSFKGTFAATIGVDFQIKTVEQDGHIIALQLWDTAGQERFRSITKQYFRKADGVVIMYDVTCESTFTNIRNWMLSVEEGVDDGTVLVLVGNKTDLIDQQNSGVVKTKDGNKLADEYGALFFETSAKSGSGIEETIDGLSSLLQEKEDKAIEAALRLDEFVVKKKGCCK
ncbi:hypothetical protein SNE40_003067 [Patella caerulea]|uniref:EF-hand domain-containing protein n=1 Tax=Patella caerulea TaxID=87958 RepID=A0AAN8KA68_PATCE